MTVSKGEVNSDNKRQAHPWYNENVKEKKTKQGKKVVQAK